MKIFKSKKSAFVLKATAAALVLIMAGTSPAMALSEAYINSREIGNSTTYYNGTGQTTVGAAQVNYVEYTPNADISPMVVYGSKLYGKSTITAVANYVEGLGKEVIAAINGDFFDMKNGLPIGIVIKDGELISSNLGYYAVGFKADGSAVMGKPVTTMTINGASGKVTVDCFNKVRSLSSIFLLDTNFSKETRLTSAGTNIVLERLTDDPVTVNVDIVKTSSSTPIAENQMVLTVSDSGPVGRLPDFKIGEQVTLTTSTTGGSWNDVLYALGGKALLQNGTIDTGDSPGGSNARSAVGIKADGTVVMYEVDKNNPYSLGMTPYQLAQEMQALGCVNAINLDGGGSSAMAIQLPGNADSTVVNTPSGGSLRPCANYIVLVNNTRSVGNAVNLHVYPANYYVLKGGSVNLALKATDKNYYPVDLPSSVSYTVDNKMGTVTNSVFTAGTTAGTATINVSGGNATGSQKLFILESIDSIIVKSGTSAISSLSLSAGEKVDLNASGSYKNMAVAAGDKSFSWQVKGNVGTITAEGVFTASGIAGTGSVVVSYGGITKEIPVTVSLGTALGDAVINDFESKVGFTATPNAALSLVSTNSLVHNGYKALQIVYDFTSSDYTSLDYTSTSIGNASYVSAWFLDDGAATKIYANFTNTVGAQMSVQLTAKATASGYKQISGAIPSGAVYFTGLALEKGSATNGKIYLDRLYLTTGGEADTEAPSIKFTSVPANVAAKTKAQLTVNITDKQGASSLPASNIKVWVDGVSTSFTANALTGNISFYTPTLSAGIHHITVEATDTAGNLARKSVNISVNGSASSQFTDTANHWAASYIDFMAAKSVIKGETDASGSLIFAPSRNLSRMEFAVIMARYLGLDTEAEVKLPYSDAVDIPAWALGAVKAVYKAGIMQGSTVNGKTLFNPKASIVRSEVMTVIGRSLAKGYTITQHNFTDSAKIPAWAAEHINTLVSMGIVGGYSDGSIAPQKNITRAEIAKILYGLY